MTSTSTNNGAYTDVASQTRQATEKSVEVFKNSAKSFTDQLDQFKIPTVDLTEPVARYFEFVQQAVDLNRELATKWAELLTTMSGSFREQAERVTGVVQDQTDTVADLTVKQAEKAEKAEQVAKEQADKAERAKRERAEEAEEAEKAKTREAKRVEREEARKAREKAREAYEGLTKAELSDQLAGRGLPKTGNVEDLIERLVGADTE